MDNIFLIQFLQGEITALKALNVTDRGLALGYRDPSNRAFMEGRVSARDAVIRKYQSRIEEAELEMSLYVG